MSVNQHRILVLDDSDYRDRFVEAVNRPEQRDFDSKSETKPQRQMFFAEGVGTLNDACLKLKESITENAPYFCIIVDQFWDQENDMSFGFEASKQLRRIKPDLLVVIYSNRVDLNENFKEEAFRAGAIRYLPKMQKQTDMENVANRFLPTLFELASLKSALEERQRLEQKVTVLTRTIEAGHTIIDSEKIVWFISDSYQRLLGEKIGRLGIDPQLHLPRKLDTNCITPQCLRMLNTCFGNPGFTNKMEETKFLPEPSPHGTFIRVVISPFGEGENGVLAAIKVVTPIPPELLDPRYRVECILQATGFSSAWVYKADETQNQFTLFCMFPSAFERRRKWLGSLHSISERPYLANILTLNKPRLYYSDDFQDADFNQEFDVQWPKLAAPLKVDEVIIGIVCAESSDQRILKEDDREILAIYLPGLVSILHQPRTPLADKRRKWLERLAGLRLEFLRNPDLSWFYQALTEAIQEATESDMAHFRIPEGNNLVMTGDVGRYGKAARTGTRASIPKNSVSNSARCFNLKMPIYRDAFQIAFRDETLPVTSGWTKDEIDAFKDINSAAYLPLMRDEECYGTLALYSLKQAYYSTNQALILQIASEAADYISSAVLAARAVTSARLALSLQKDNLHKLAYRMQRLDNENELLRHFAVGMIEDQVVGFKRIILAELEEGPIDILSIRLAIGPSSQTKSTEFEGLLDSGSLPEKYELNESDNFIREQQNTSDSKQPINLKGWRKTLQSPLPFRATANILQVNTIREFPTTIQELFNGVDVGQIYWFKLQLGSRRQLLGFCDSVYTMTSEGVKLAEELIGHLELAMARQRLQKQDTEKVWRRLVGMASHRLRSLIPPIIDQADLALKRGPRLTVDNRLAIIKDAAIEAHKFLDELTVLSNLNVKPDQRFSVPAFVEWIEARISERFPKQDFIFRRLTIADDLSVLVDSSCFLAALIELVQDSNKHGVKAGRDLKISLSFNSGDTFRLIYEDNGDGIPIDLRQTLFEPFAPLSPVKGTGLGLAIVKSTILQHNGKITEEGLRIKNQLNEGRMFPAGVCFVIELPVKM